MPNVTLPQNTSFGGVAPIIVHHAGKNETVEECRGGFAPSAGGLGVSPRPLLCPPFPMREKGARAYVVGVALCGRPAEGGTRIT